MDIINSHMLIDPALQATIIARILAANLGDEPNRAVHELGTVALPDGTARKLFLRHAADAIIIDAQQNIILITRSHNPGAGLQALPGGFLDDIDGQPESTRAAAIREAIEETGISQTILESAKISLLGPRRYNRPFDIRAAWNNLPGTSIFPGDFFCVSTRGIVFKIPGNLAKIPLTAGDDARAVQVASIATLTPAQFAVPDHLEMIREALK